MKFLINRVGKEDQILYTFTDGVFRGVSNLTAAPVASQRVGTLRVLWADPTVEAFINVWGAVEDIGKTKD